MIPASATAAVLTELRKALRGEVQVDVPLAPRTSVRVGGSADLFVKPASLSELQSALAILGAAGVGHGVLGAGANTVVGDLGVRGAVLRLPADLAPEEIEEDARGASIALSAGAPIARLIALCKARSLVGAEFLAGIPGTIGGAAFMNAGTRRGETGTLVEAIEVVAPAGVAWVSAERVGFVYRGNGLEAGSVISRVRFRLSRGDVSRSQVELDEDLAHRKRTQPLSLPNSGSVFRNPPGHFAGRLIEDAGLKGHRIGGAAVSDLHANFIVNLGDAKAADVVALMELAINRVAATSGVILQPEVKLLGDFGRDVSHLQPERGRTASSPQRRSEA